MNRSAPRLTAVARCVASAALSRYRLDNAVASSAVARSTGRRSRRASSSGRIINISSALGFLPAPYGALYAASKHAVEGYSESVDHEVREHGVRVLLVEPAYTSTGFDANVVQPDTPLPVYAQQRHIAGQVVAAGLKDGDDPATVAKVIVVAATDPKPKLRIPPTPPPDASARCAASPPPGPSTGRSASSTGWPAERTTRPAMLE